MTDGAVKISADCEILKVKQRPVEVVVKREEVLISYFGLHQNSQRWVCEAEGGHRKGRG